MCPPVSRFRRHRSSSAAGGPGPASNEDTAADPDDMGGCREEGPAHSFDRAEEGAFALEDLLKAAVFEHGDLVFMGIENENPPVLPTVKKEGRAEHRHVFHRFELGRDGERLPKRAQEFPGLVENMEDLAGVRADGHKIFRARTADRGNHEIHEERPDKITFRSVHDDLALRH